MIRVEKIWFLYIQGSNENDRFAWLWVTQLNILEYSVTAHSWIWLQDRLWIVVLCTKQPPSFSINHDVQTRRCDQYVFGFSGPDYMRCLGSRLAPGFCMYAATCADGIRDIFGHSVAAWLIDAVRGRFSQRGSVNPEVWWSQTRVGALLRLWILLAKFVGRCTGSMMHTCRVQFWKHWRRSRSSLLSRLDGNMLFPSPSFGAHVLMSASLCVPLCFRSQDRPKWRRASYGHQGVTLFRPVSDVCVVAGVSMVSIESWKVLAMGSPCSGDIPPSFEGKVTIVVIWHGPITDETWDGSEFQNIQGSIFVLSGRGRRRALSWHQTP